MFLTEFVVSIKPFLFFFCSSFLNLNLDFFATCTFVFGRWVEDVECFEKVFWKTIFHRFYIIIVSHASFRVNLHSIVCLNVKELLAWSRRNIWSLSDSNAVWTHNHLVRKRPSGLFLKKASLAKWLSVRLRTKWLWVRILLLSLKLQIWCLFSRIWCLFCTCKEFLDILANYKV